MRRLVVVVFVVLLAGLPAAASAGPAGSTLVSDPSIGPECAGAGATHTPDVVTQGATVAATWTIGRDRGIGLALSHDRGRSWARRALPFTTCTGGPLEGAVDPDLALGADGQVWASASGPLPVDGAVDVSTGDAEGRTLVAVGDRPAVSVFPGVTTERGFLETDPTDADRGWVLTETLTRAYVAVGPGGVPAFLPGGPEGRLLLGRTDDRGRTWTSTTLRSHEPGTTLLALGLVRTGGALMALSVRVDLKDPMTLAQIAASGGLDARGAIASQTSLDDGRTWSEPVELGVVDRASLLDAGSGDGLVAVAAAQPDGTLLVWTSEDQGATWRQTTAGSGVAGPATGVAVDRRGRVVVLSYDLAAAELLAQVSPTPPMPLTPQVSVSGDRGRSFSTPLALAGTFDGSTVTSGSHVPPYGPYNGAAAQGLDVLVAFVADEDQDGRTETRLARVG